MDDSIWDPTQQVQTVYFSNSAKWGEYSSTTKTEVKHESQIISKKGQYDNSTGYVRYSVVINPDKLKLGTDKMIELVDDMHPDGNESNTAALVRSTVKLYSYDPTAPDKKGAEIADGVYTVDYKETQRNQRNHYILTVSVPNGYAYVLEYAYRNTSNTSYQMKNTAELCGKTFEATPTKHMLQAPEVPLILPDCICIRLIVAMPESCCPVQRSSCNGLTTAPVSTRTSRL